MSLHPADPSCPPATSAHPRAPLAGTGRRERWYVAETIPHKEALALEHLRRQGFHGFCPRLRKVRSHARKRQQVLVPLFPNYVFIRLDPEHRAWRSINGTIGVKRLLGSEGGAPRTMPEAAMDCILARCENGIVGQFVEQPKQGQAVRIMTGPFADSIAAVETMDERGRVSVLLDILGRRTCVRMTIDSLEPVERP